MLSTIKQRQQQQVPITQLGPKVMPIMPDGFKTYHCNAMLGVKFKKQNKTKQNKNLKMAPNSKTSTLKLATFITHTQQLSKEN